MVRAFFALYNDVFIDVVFTCIAVKFRHEGDCRVCGENVDHESDAR